MAVSLTTTLVLCCATLALVTRGRAEYFSSIERMKQLLTLEESYLADLDRYIRLHEEKVGFLRRQRTDIAREVKRAAKDPDRYVSNPIDGFMLTSRLLNDWSRLGDFMRMGIGAGLRNATEVPTQADIEGIVEALGRLQDIHRMGAREVAEGQLSRWTIDRQLTTADCYQLGKQLALAKDFPHAAEWYRESLRRWTTENPGVSKVEILNALSFALSQLFEYGEALDLIQQVLKLQPDHQYALEARKSLEQWVEHEQTHGKQKPKEPPNHGNYSSLCRGDFKRPATLVATLHCRYVDNGYAFLRIGPLKMELLNHDPHVAIFHEVIYDSEIALMQQLTRATLTRSMVGDNEKKEISKSRTGSNAWLSDHQHPTIRTVTRRTEFLSGLDMRSAEQFQIANYGIGGQYLPHHDYSNVRDGAEVYQHLGTGNRIATIMYYLSDVEAGGATVFPKIGVGAFPRKGSAIFWYNLHANGKPDERTLHGACPVLIGSKWVANKWIHEKHQQFRRPCKLLQPDA